MDHFLMFTAVKSFIRSAMSIIINKFWHSKAMLHWNKALWLVKISHLTIFNQSECINWAYVVRLHKICSWPWLLVDTFRNILISALKYIRKIKRFFCKEWWQNFFPNPGPWWRSSGQHARLILRQSEFECRWILQFFRRYQNGEWGSFQNLQKIKIPKSSKISSSSFKTFSSQRPLPNLLTSELASEAAISS